MMRLRVMVDRAMKITGRGRFVVYAALLLAFVGGVMRLHGLRQGRSGAFYIPTSQNRDMGHPTFGSLLSPVLDAIRMALKGSVDAAEPLSTYVPQGSLMAIEAPDFAGLLGAWTNSAEEKAWVKSDNYAEFSNSRLFSRLGEAQGEFAASAGLEPDGKFLANVAGGESLFAWYDIGKLEFLYVTRMKPGEAAKNPLMKLADKFQLRKAGADSFYVRAEAGGAPSGTGGDASQDDGQTDSGSESGTVRTVAFAVHGDLLFLATREDLIANALLLAQHQGDATLRSEPWYTAAVSAVSAEKDARPDMRMTLNLARIVPSPYFRSYWVQRNVTEMKQYSAAVSDLYRTPGAFREERVLIPKASDREIAAGDVTAVMRYLPAGSGVYRATAVPSSAEVVDAMDGRLIARGPAPYRDLRVAPVADLSETAAGSAGDLDTRIDEQPLPEEPMANALAPLRGLVEAQRPDAMLVYSTAATAEKESVFAPIHAAVVLSAKAPWDVQSAQATVVQALQARLTVGGVGLSWKARQAEGESWMELSGLQPLAMAVRGEVLVVATDSETLFQMLRSAKMGATTGTQYASVKTVAGFSHSGERERFRRLSGLLDGPPVKAGGDAGAAAAPAFFSGNVGGLSDAFKALDSETFVEAPMENDAVRQTVVYRWKR